MKDSEAVIVGLIVILVFFLAWSLAEYHHRDYSCYILQNEVMGLLDFNDTNLTETARYVIRVNPTLNASAWTSLNTSRRPA